MSAQSRAADALADPPAVWDFEAVFRLYYARVARLIGRVVRDPGRAEELAVEVFWKLSRTPAAHGDRVGGWLYTSAVRAGLYELRREARRERFAHLLRRDHERPPDPEELRAAAEEQRQVRDVLARLPKRQSELVLLRSSGMSYEELAAALNLNPASVGTLLSRAQQAFRKEYIQRYGER
ncbi:MAG TPA: sigma-70 family RNA polymerase sigma factor [Candidatus Solibacter sp.]|nr:sigma-70 family RNA polymerase sigma factor [Candidatus Solibacter sp.]